MCEGLWHSCMIRLRRAGSRNLCALPSENASVGSVPRLMHNYATVRMAHTCCSGAVSSITCR
jgi:hypothetical protein